MRPTFGTNALIKLAERTKYETWLLEAVYSLSEQELFPSWPDGMVYAADNSKVQFYEHGRCNGVIFDWRPYFLSAGAPLIFVSTFKLLDMLIEWTFEENELSPPFQFQKKLEYLNNTNSFVFHPVIESRMWLKERLIGLYRTLEPLRGTIIHERHFTATDGNIRVASSKRNNIGPSVEINSANLRKFTLTIVSILKYIDGIWQLDKFREKTLRHDLDEIVTLHGQPLLGQKLPIHTCVRVYLTGSDPLLFDLSAIKKDIAKKYTTRDFSFDLRVLIVKEDKVTDAYLFPWSIFENKNANWSQSINTEPYRTDIPGDIKPEHLRQNTDHPTHALDSQ